MAGRYLRSKSKWNIVNIISASASFVLIIAVCSFFVVLSVFSGLKDFGINYSKAFDPEIKITSSSSKYFVLEDSVYKNLQNIPGVAFLSKTIKEKVLVQN